MKTLRPIRLETCCICGEEFDAVKMREVFTGRIKYICPDCYMRADSQAAARSAAKKNFKREKAAPVGEGSGRND